MRPGQIQQTKEVLKWKADATYNGQWAMFDNQQIGKTYY
jgi:hypothetical protein